MKETLKLTSTGKNSSGIQVFAYTPDGTVAPRADEIITGKEWIPFGKDNLFLERMRSLWDNCVPLDQCGGMNALYLAGRRVVINRKQGDKLVPHEQALELYAKWTADQGESEFRFRTMMDVAFGNARTWHDRYDANGNLASLQHLDLMSVRRGKPDPVKKRVVQEFVSPNWKKAASRSSNLHESYVPVPYPSWNFENRRSAESKAQGQIEYLMGYKNGRRFYGEPFWLACIPDAQNWAKVPVMYRADLDMGFSADVWVHVEGKLTPAQQADLARQLQSIYAGTRGNRIMTTTASVGEKVTITPIPKTNHAGERDAMRDAAKLEIVNANRIPSILANIDVKVGMSGQAPAIPQQWQRYVRTFIEPMQDLFFERPLLARLKNAGINDIEELFIEVFSPFDEVADEVQQRMAYMRTTKINEHRTLVQKLPPLTLPGSTDANPIPDPRGEMLLIEAGPSLAPPQEQSKGDEKKKEEKDDDDLDKEDKDDQPEEK